MTKFHECFLRMSVSQNPSLQLFSSTLPSLTPDLNPNGRFTQATNCTLGCERSTCLRSPPTKRKFLDHEKKGLLWISRLSVLIWTETRRQREDNENNRSLRCHFCFHETNMSEGTDAVGQWYWFRWWNLCWRYASPSTMFNSVRFLMFLICQNWGELGLGSSRYSSDKSPVLNLSRSLVRRNLLGRLCLLVRPTSSCSTEFSWFQFSEWCAHANLRSIISGRNVLACTEWTGVRRLVASASLIKSEPTGIPSDSQCDLLKSILFGLKWCISLFLLHWKRAAISGFTDLWWIHIWQKSWMACRRHEFSLLL